MSREEIMMEIMRNNGGIRIGQSTLHIRSRTEIAVRDWEGEERVFGSLTAAVDDFHLLNALVGM